MNAAAIPGLPTAGEVTPAIRRGSIPALESTKITVTQVLAAFWLPIVAMLLRFASAPTANASYLLVAAYALTGVRQALVSLYLCWFFNMLNHRLFPLAGMAALFRYAIILCAFTSVIIHCRRRSWRKSGMLVPATAILSIFLILHSLVISEQTDISLLKAVSFSLSVLAMANGWPSLDDRNRRLTTAFLFGTTAAIAVVSLPFARLSFGYATHRNFFQGIMVHSMNFGPTVAVLGAATVAAWLSERRLRLWYLAVFGICMLEIGLSKCRIAGLALVAGVALSLLGEGIRVVIAARSSDKPMRFRRLVVFGLMSLVIVAATWRQLSVQVTEFIRKGFEEEATLTEVAAASRGAKLAELLANIERKPLAGAGFGVAPGADYFGIARDPVFNLPMMATVEKGIMPVAVIEETGVIGACFVFPWLFLLTVRATRAGVVNAAVLWSILVTNLAEANFFSPGGQGMFQLSLALWACSAPVAAVTPRTTQHNEQSRTA